VGERRPFTKSELEAVLELADDEWKSLIRFGLYTGQRLGDLASLTWSNIDLVRKEIRLVTRKNGTHMNIPIAPTLLDHILTLPSSDRSGTPIHPRAYEVLRTHQGRAGLLSNWFVDLLIEGRRESWGKEGRNFTCQLGNLIPLPPTHACFHAQRRWSFTSHGPRAYWPFLRSYLGSLHSRRP
jgi:integrase